MGPLQAGPNLSGIVCWPTLAERGTCSGWETRLMHSLEEFLSVVEKSRANAQNGRIEHEVKRLWWLPVPRARIINCVLSIDGFQLLFNSVRVHTDVEVQVPFYRQAED